MSVITPMNTTIVLFNNIPIEPDYENTLWFETSVEQKDYFDRTANTLIRFDKNSYQRKDNNTIQVKAILSQCDTANYMYFVNGSHENKRYYCFVDRVSYINEMCTEIHYTIDYIQTYMFDYTFAQCYVERQHSVTDNVGDNLISDFNFDLGEYYSVTTKELNFKTIESEKDDDTLILYPVIFVNKKLDELYDSIDPGDTFSNGIENGTYPKNNFYGTQIFQRNTQVPIIIDGNSSYMGGFNTIPTIYQATNVDNAIKFLNEKKISPYVVAVNFGVKFSEYGAVNYANTVGKLSITVDDIKSGFAAYFPFKNNKVLSYPYTKVVLSTPNTQTEYTIEDFGNTISFNIFAYFGISPSMLAIPTKPFIRKTIQNSIVVYTDLPTAQWSADAYSYWLALNNNQLKVKTERAYSDLIGSAANTILGLASFGVSAASDNIGGAISGAKQTNAGAWGVQNAVLDIANVNAVKEDKQNLADSLKGVPLSSNIYGIENVYIKTGFILDIQTLNEQYLRSIDDYWTMFGYPQNRVSIPNKHARSRYTFVKTRGCKLNKQVYGTLPAEAEKTICAIHDKGIRYWADVNHVGDYQIENSIIT